MEENNDGNTENINVAIGAASLLGALTTNTADTAAQAARGGTMATEQNKAAARRWSEELWGRGDLAVADEIIAPVRPPRSRRSVSGAWP